MKARNKEMKYAVVLVDGEATILEEMYFSNKKKRDAYAKQALVELAELFSDRTVSALFYQLDFTSDTGEY